LPIRLTLTRVVWATLPITVGPVAVAALEAHSTPVRVVVAVWLVSIWLAALAGLVVPRPFGLTVLRAAASVAPGVAAWAVLTGAGSIPVRIVAAVAGATAFALALGAAVATWCVEGSAYGDERRFPLRTPPALVVTLVPAAVALLAAGSLTGPVLLAVGRWVPGAVALVVGVALGFAAFRSLHLLSRRFVVLVPAGIVVADPMTLTDPFLFVRDHVVDLAPLPDGRAPEGALDLRLGAAFGSVALHLDGEAPLTLRRRSTSVPAASSCVLVSPVRRADLLDAAAQRRIRTAR
jgi:hypothetical protein